MYQLRNVYCWDINPSPTVGGHDPENNETGKSKALQEIGGW
jgi:hypothetical protein